MHEYIKEKIIGTWKLVSWKYKGEDNQLFDFFGESPQGILMYGASGYMNAQLMKAERSNFLSESLTDGSLEEVREAYLSYAAYYGKYYENSPGEIIHIVEGSLFPNWVGHQEIRYGQINGEYLILTTPPIHAKGKEIIFIVTWRRN